MSESNATTQPRERARVEMHLMLGSQLAAGMAADDPHNQADPSLRRESWALYMQACKALNAAVLRFTATIGVAA